MRSRSSVVSKTALQTVEVYISPLILGIGPRSNSEVTAESLSGMLMVERFLVNANPTLFEGGLIYEAQPEFQLCMFGEEPRSCRRVIAYRDHPGHIKSSMAAKAIL